MHVMAHQATHQWRAKAGVNSLLPCPNVYSPVYTEMPGSKFLSFWPPRPLSHLLLEKLWLDHAVREVHVLHP